MPDAAAIVDVFLLPGDYFIGDARHRIRTLLGSCVSVTLWHPRWRVGAMSHFLLASQDARGAQPLNGRYGDDAMALMLAELRHSGIDPQHCQAKIFGGAAMFPGREGADQPSIGRRNGDVAERLLQQVGIPIVSSCRYGLRHRHIIFNVRTGDVWVRKGQPDALADRAAKEPA